MSAIHELLKRYWGYDAFRPLQEEIVRSVLSQHDTLALLPTGGGKSLCFQLPALAQEGICVVVSPLISLMRDQVSQLKRRRIKAACLVSGMNRHQQSVVLNQSVYGNLKLLYVSPERLQSKTFLEHYRMMKVNLLVVDEAHCISQWGYDFRPAYLQIAALRAYHPQVPVMALTATATPVVVQDIQQRLLFRNGQLFQASFSRSNLAYMVLCEDDKSGRMLRIVRKVGGCGIVYVGSRRRTMEVAAQLQQAGISATAYHAGLDSAVRDSRQQMWMQNQVQVMVATNAFGMGIDKPDVRFVIHWDIPTTPEAYFQEAGRAGRDGLRSYAVLLYNAADLQHLRHAVEQSFPPLSEIRNIYNAVCNFYHVPIGSGIDLRAEFCAEEICHSYNLKPSTFFCALRFLEREGLLLVPDREESVSQLLILCSRDDLYRLRLADETYNPLIEVMLRLYGGLFTDFTFIYEGEMAKRIGITEKKVRELLRRLNEIGYVSYRPKVLGRLLYLPTPRVDSTSLVLGEDNYARQKQLAYRRMEVMEQYVTSADSCRSRRLLAYFGEADAAPCGLCDVCITGRQRQYEAFTGNGGAVSAAITTVASPDQPLTLSTVEQAERYVCEQLRQQSCTVKRLADSVKQIGGGETLLVSAIRNLLDDGLVQMDSLQQLHLVQ